MKRLIRGLAMILFITIAALTVSSCTSKDDSQERLLEAISRQADITTNTFRGSISLDLDQLPAAVQDQPYTSTILNWLRQGEIAWNGSRDSTQSRGEVDLRFTSSDGTSEFTIPVIHAGDTIYVHVPMINADDEYFAIPALSLSDKLHAAALTASSELFAAMDASWFSSEEAAEGGSRIRLTITREEWPNFLKTVDETLPKILAAWQESGIISSRQADWLSDSWSELTAQDQAQLQLAEGKDAVINFALDQDGFISSVEAEINLTREDSAGAVRSYGFHIHHIWDNIGGAPPLMRDIPDTTVSIEELLKLIP